MSLTVLAPGLHSLLVDGGRPSHRALGVPVGGAADRAAWMLGNALVGNRPDALALEVTLSGPTLRADHPTVAVAYGAPFEPKRNGTPLRAGVTFALQPGDVLAVGGTPTGARGYLCVAGGFDGPTVLGSRSGLAPITADETLICPAATGPVGRSLPEVTSAALLSKSPSPQVSLSALDGPQADWFAPGFFDREWTVTPASNRMGLRLAGDPLERRPGELVSEPVAPGAVQVTNDGRPVVLGADGQTIGGYPKVAHVVRADLDLLAQLRPGDRVRFERVTLDEAGALARARAERLRGWLMRLRVGHAQACPTVSSCPPIRLRLRSAHASPGRADNVGVGLRRAGRGRRVAALGRRPRPRTAGVRRRAAGRPAGPAPGGAVRRAAAGQAVPHPGPGGPLLVAGRSVLRKVGSG